MRLVRFGDTVVNMDRVNYIETDGLSYARLFFSAPHTPNGIESLMSEFLRLHEEDAQALAWWMSDQVEETSRFTRPQMPAQASTEDIPL